MTLEWFSKFKEIRAWWARQTGRYTRMEGHTWVTDGTQQAYAEFELRLRLAPLMQSLFPSYGTCFRCKWPWPLVEYHTTKYASASGCFPLCEMCWRQLGTAERRMPYYHELWDEWMRQGCTNVKWTDIEAAVNAEGGMAWIAGPS